MAHLEQLWRDPTRHLEVACPRRPHFTLRRSMSWVSAIARSRQLEAVRRAVDLPPLAKTPPTDHAAFAATLNEQLNSFRAVLRQRLDRRQLLMLANGADFCIPTIHVARDLELVGARSFATAVSIVYHTHEHVDGAAPGKAHSCPAAFCLADKLLAAGRRDEARPALQRLIGLSILGLLSKSTTHSRPSSATPSSLHPRAASTRPLNLRREEASPPQTPRRVGCVCAPQLYTLTTKRAFSCAD